MQANSAVDIVRRKYLKLLFEYTERNVIAYYSGFLSKPGVLQADISDEDKNGFMMAVHKLDRSKGLDLILHTPGGDIAATQSIVDYLHKMFDHNIRAVIPQIAMSAGTMIACSCHEVIMSNHSNIGPIDPHLSGVPAFGVIQEFRRACKEIKSDPSKIPVWQAIIGQYRPTFLSRCENAIKWSNTFVQEQLEDVMFEGESDAGSKSRNIVKKLTDYSKNKTHNRHIHFEECSKMDLKVTKLESDPKLQDLVLTVHHCYMHALMNTPAYKMIENHLGVALVKREATSQRQ
ncbi:MAG: Serine protease [Dehalococcoidales bacterium]|nr:Serine protease [Dehalococcoidales bacterium]